MIVTVIKARELIDCNRDVTNSNEVLPGGGPMSPVWILKRLVLVLINACCLLSALPSLSQFGRGRLSLVEISFYMLSLLFGPCRLLEFTLAGPQQLHWSTHKKDFKLSVVKNQISSCWATWEDSCQHFVMPPLVSLQNDVWETNTEILCWWCVTTQILVVLLVEANFPLGTTNQNTQIRVVTHH